MKYLLTILGILLVSSSLTKAQADCNNEPPGGLAPIAAYSIFLTNYQNGDYQYAINYGKWIICAKPAEIEGAPRYSLSTQYERLIKSYEELARSKEDPSVRAAYLDTAMVLFNESMEEFGDDQETKFEIIFRRGRFYQQNYDFIDNGLQKAYSDYETVFEIDAEKVLSLGKGYYARIVLDNMVSKGRKADAREFINTIEPLANDQLLGYLDDKRKDLLGSPQEQIDYYGEILKSEPNNLEALKAIAKAYEELDMRKELIDVRRKLHELEPSFTSALELAEIELSNANYSGAATFFQEALEKAPSDTDKKEIYIELAKVNLNRDNHQTARRYARQALDIDSNYGEAFLQIALIYADAVTECTNDRKLDPQDRVVYWLVIDYLNRAKSVDSSVSSRVNSQLAAYEPVTPTTEDRFLTLNLEKGEEVTVDGSLMPCYSWINETTTAR